MADAKRLDDDTVRDMFELKGLIIVEETFNYRSSKTKIEFICKKHMDYGIQSTTYSILRNGGYGCKKCRYEKVSGKNSQFWKGGVTPIVRFLRDSIKDWKIQSMQKDNYKCCLTIGDEGNFEVHHLHSFNKIFEEFAKSNNLTIKNNISDYSDDELESIKEKFLKEHNNTLGVCLNYMIHKFYHKTYGYNNTPEQFEEFKIRYRFGEFNDLLNKNIKQII